MVTKELQALKRQLSNNDLSKYYADLLFNEMDPNTLDLLNDLTQFHLNRYSEVPEIRSIVNSGDPDTQIKAILDVFPAFSLILSSELNINPEHFNISKLMQITGIASNLTRFEESDSLVSTFLNCINPKEKIELLNRKISDQSPGYSYLPKMVNFDFLIIKKKYNNLMPSEDINELIEIIFCFQGLIQIYLKYYFDLVCQATSDVIVLHIDKIFSGLFATLKYQEIKYWNNYTDSSKLQSEIQQLIEMDDPENSHPVIRRHIFEGLQEFNPLFKDSRVQYSDPDIQQFHAKQLDTFLNFSVQKMALVLGAVQICKGRSHLVYLLAQILKTNSQKLFLIHKIIKSSAIRENKELIQMVEYFVKKISKTHKRTNLKSSQPPGMVTIIETAESLRRKKAMKLQQEKKNVVSLTNQQVSSFIETRMKRLYDRIKIKGALTQDNVSSYLNKFATAAQPLFEHSTVELQHQAIENFRVSTANILQGIYQKGSLNKEKIYQYNKLIQENIELLYSAGQDKYNKILDQIGIIISEAENKSLKGPDDDLFQDSKIIRTPNEQKESTIYTDYELSKKNSSFDINNSKDFSAKYLAHFNSYAKQLVTDVPVEQQEEAFFEVKTSVNTILKKMMQDGFIQKEKLEKYERSIQQKLSTLLDRNLEDRSKILGQVESALFKISSASNKKAQSILSFNPQKPIDDILNSGRKLMENEIPLFLENYLKKLHQRSRIDGDLTEKRVSEYLTQFSQAAQKIVIEIPSNLLEQQITEFELSTDEILHKISSGGNLPTESIYKYQEDINKKSHKLRTPNTRNRIRIVDQIGLVLADASEESQKQKKPTIDEHFLTEELIPYGLDNQASLLSMNDFFALPFADRTGPNEKNWFEYHLKYLEMAKETNKLESEIFQKIKDSLSAIKKKKYKKYFNIFPNDTFEETTFMAVFDLWQNKALERLLIE